ncbi:MAG: LamG domain-containing protein [Bacteroidetes bacterium]|jgi:hypothetical protein|nr:LamG domain-containing protein [Bacteroidota bacterium]
MELNFDTMRKIVFSLLLALCSLSALYGQGARRSVYFDSNGYIQVADVSQLDLATRFTVESWTKIEADGILLMKGGWCPNVVGGSGGEGAQSYFFAYSNNTLGFFINTGGDFFHLIGSVSAPVQLENGAWHHIAASFDSGFLSLYHNGILLASGRLRLDSSDPAVAFTTQPDGFAYYQSGSVRLQWNGFPSVNYTGLMSIDQPYPGASALRIGSAVHYCSGSTPVISNAMTGQMDEIRVWNRALTAAEIRHKMTERLTGTEPGLVAYYRMDEGADNTCPGGQDVCDASGNGNHGVKF